MGSIYYIIDLEHQFGPETGHQAHDMNEIRKWFEMFPNMTWENHFPKLNNLNEIIFFLINFSLFLSYRISIPNMV